jgi:hypothetical protein
MTSRGGPRWTNCDAKIFGVKLPTDVPVSIRERACTTSIWCARSGGGTMKP